jgi:threonylcarbamoyladenosine tRNA methylthiotransferase CDKAL1
MKAYVEAYGCTLNFGESREIEDLLSTNGWDIVDDPEGADLAVLATCVVIDATERVMVKRIRELSGAKRLLITGCMATAGREKAEKVAPNAQFAPPGDVSLLLKIIDEGRIQEEREPEVRESFGIVPIATGCRGRC